MKLLELKNGKTVFTLDEFHDVYATSSGIELCDTKTKASEIFKKIKNNKTIILSGEYSEAEAILWYVHHFEEDLVSDTDIDYYNSVGMELNYAAIKRIKMHRLNYLCYKNEMPYLTGSNNKEEIIEWLSEEVGDKYYLLPARRYMRILTDIKRASNGIIFDHIDSVIHIAPFVYVPFDKSVPEMFLDFRECFVNKNVIDIGTGTGILAIIAAKMGANGVTAVDINPNAVECAKKNIICNGLENVVSNILCTDLFNGIQGRFDTIIFNAPWIIGNPKNVYEIAIYDPGYRVISRFFEQAKTHMTEDGTILLQYSDISQVSGEGSMDNLDNLLLKNDLKIVSQKSILRRNRLLGAMERVYIFAIKN